MDAIYRRVRFEGRGEGSAPAARGSRPEDRDEEESD